MPARFGGKDTSWDSPATQSAAVTPSDTVDIAGGIVRALWVGGGGSVAVMLGDDTAATTYAGVPAGTLLPFAVKRVFATGTTATLLVGVR